MVNPISSALSHLVLLLIAVAVTAVTGGTVSAQVTWPTLPPGFTAATNQIDVWDFDPLPGWAEKALAEDNVELLESSIWAMPGQQKAEQLKQRMLIRSLSTPSLKVAEWCLINGASVGWHLVHSGRRVEGTSALDLAVGHTNLPMVRLLIAAGAAPKRPQVIVNGPGVELLFLDLTEEQFEARQTSKHLELAGLLVRGGFDPFATNYFLPPVVSRAVAAKNRDLAEVLLTNQPLSVLRSERGAMSLTLSAEHGLTNAATFLRSVLAPIDR